MFLGDWLILTNADGDPSNFYSKLQEKMRQNLDGPLQLANKVYVQSGFSLKPDYISTIRDCFSGGSNGFPVESINFK